MPSRLKPSPHVIVIAGALVFVLVATFWLFAIRIEPSALLLRTYYEKLAAATAVETDHYGPSVSVTAKRGQNYGDGGAETSFTVYRPESAKREKLPTVVWIHGGGWISGSNVDVEPYLRKLASAHYTVVALNYPLSPANEFPVATQAINSALRYLTSRSTLYGIDSSRIVLAGNSAGANLAAQVAALHTNPQYAAALGITPALRPEQLAGVVLNGGLYDVSAAAELTGVTGWVTRVELRAYTGERYPLDSADAALISVTNGVSADFPATWMTGGDADQLTQNQLVPFSQELARHGVPASLLIPDAGSALPPDYQFMLALPQAKRAFASMLDFVHDVTSR